MTSACIHRAGSYSDFLRRAALQREAMEQLESDASPAGEEEGGALSQIT